MRMTSPSKPIRRNYNNDRIDCPVTGCRNCGGKGYKRSYIIRHMRDHVTELKRSSEERDKVSKKLREFSNHVCCKDCCFVVADANNSGLCRVCARSSVPSNKIINPLADTERAAVQKRIRSANRTKIRILSEIPNTLRRLWSNCVAATLAKFADAKTELE